MDKGTLLYLLARQGHNRKNIKNKSEDELTALLTHVDDTLIAQRTAHHAQYHNHQLSMLKEECRLRGIPYSGKTKMELMDELFSCPIKTVSEVRLDEDQRNIVERDLLPCQLVSAGPGSGKTMTIVHLLAKHTSDKTCLVLAFNRAARDNLKDRLKRMGKKIMKKSDVFSVCQSGLFVMDFDEFAFQAVRKTDPSYIPLDYTATKDKSILSLQRIPFTVDLFVVDEAQDLSHVLGKMTDMVAMKSKHIYIFGDPRQELYPGCTWFSSRWTHADPSVRTHLRYNHRSGKKIVDFLNNYSRTNFPTLHIDQIATREDDGQVLFYESPDMSAPNTYTEMCFLSPISVRRYNQEVKTKEIRQIVYTHFGLAPRLMDGDNKDFDFKKECVIATSKKFKGLEKDCVFVFGLDVDYCNLNIPWEALVKALFVCISRPRDKLVLLYNESTMKKISSPLHTLLPGCVIKTVYHPMPIDYNMYLSIDELSEQELGETKVLSTQECHTVDIDPQNDDDFVANFLRKLVAKQLGVLKQGKLKNVDDPKDYRIYQDLFGNSSRHKFLGHQNDYYFCTNSFRMEEGNQTLSCYELAQLDYSNTIQQLWTVSERVKTLCDTPIPIPIPTGVCFETFEKIPIMDSRRESIVAMLISRPDFSMDGYRAHIHFGSEVDAKTRRKVGLFAWSGGLSSAYVYNLKTGTQEEVGALHDPSLYIHAFAVMRLAQTVHIRIKTPMACPPEDTCVAIDFETRGFTNRITEVGAVRYNPFTRKVLGVYHRIVQGVAVGQSSETWSRLTNLQIVDEALFEDSQKDVWEQLYKWCGDALIVHWAGSEGSLFPNTLDAYRLYLQWTTVQNIGLRHGNDLSAAADRLFCEQLPFTPHRALDDAIATMAIHIAIGNYGGTL